jgi:hypothetical protein
MSTIRVICPVCTAPVELRPAGLLLLAESATAASGTCVFSCDTCGRVAAQRVRPPEIAVLASAGARLEASADRPGAPPARSRPGRPFTPDDLLDFHQLLAGDDPLARLMGDRPTT